MVGLKRESKRRIWYKKEVRTQTKAKKEIKPNVRFERGQLMENDERVTRESDEGRTATTMKAEG